MGVSQQKALDLGLTVTDIMIFAWIKGLAARNPKTIEKDGKIYYWVSSATLLEDLPIIKLNKRNLRVHLRKMEDAGILTHYQVKKDGNFSYYGFGEKAEELEYTLVPKLVQGVSQKVQPLVSEIVQQRLIYQNKLNNNSYRDKSLQ